MQRFFETTPDEHYLFHKLLTNLLFSYVTIIVIYFATGSDKNEYFL